MMLAIIFCKNVATTIKRKFDKYWGSFDEINLITFVAQDFDPRYKFQLIEIHLEELDYNPIQIEDLSSRVKAHLDRMYKAYKDKNVERSYVEEDDNDVKSVESRAKKRLKLQIRVAKLKEISNEVDNKYLNDAFESPWNDEFNLLDWWRSNVVNYLTIAKVARDVFVIPSSTVATENAF